MQNDYKCFVTVYEVFQMSGDSRIKRSTLLLCLAWLLMIIGLFIPVIQVPVPEPHMGSLLFFGLPIPEVTNDGSINIMTHIPIEGLKVIGFMMSTVIEKASLKWEWGVLLILTAPLFLALISPALIWIKSFSINIILALIYGFSWTIPGLLMLISAESDVIGTGYYIWTAALFLLCCSRGVVCWSSWNMHHE